MSASFTPTAEMLDAVAEWHQRQADLRIRRPLVPHLCERFGLSAKEAIDAIRMANKGGAHASGS